MEQKLSTIELYDALLLCNDTVNHARTQKQLLDAICHNMVQINGISMAWVGIVENGSTQIHPVAYAGEGSDYLKEISIDLSDPLLGEGPTGKAYKNDKPYWAQNFLNDPATKPWHEKAKKYGWHSSATLPLKKNGFVAGVLSLYSTKLEAFSDETKTLLHKMVSNLNHALETIDNEIARSKAEEALSESYNLLNSIINSLPTRIFWKDKNLTYMGCNTVFANDAGKKSPHEMIGKSDHEMTWKDQADLYNADDKNVMESGTAKLFFEEPQTTPDGETIWLRTSKVPLKNAHNEVIGILGIYDDITKQKNIENELRKSKQQLNAIIENEPACVKLIDTKGNLVNMNPAGLSMLEAASPEEAKQKPLDEYLLPKWQSPFLELHQKVMQGGSGSLEFEIQGLKGTQKWLETHAVPMYDEDNNVNALLGLTRDITDKKLSQERIVFMANYDPLTELPNRSNLEEKLEYIISLSKRNNWNFALMFLDLDNFKDINDTLGHNIGDKLLIKLGKKLRDNLRAEDTLARLGGDEFIILLPNTDPNEAKEVAQKILGIIYEPISIGDNQLTVSASIGISIFPNDGTDKETLYKNADAAMYNAKSSGKNNFYFFTEEMHKTSRRPLKTSFRTSSFLFS